MKSTELKIQKLSKWLHEAFLLNDVPDLGQMKIHKLVKLFYEIFSLGLGLSEAV